MKVSCRMYEQKEDLLLAACDEEILGVLLEGEEIQLEVKENFYGGDTIDIDSVSEKKRLNEKFERATIGNLVGENVVEAAIEAGFGDEDDIIRIDGVPHIQVVRL